MRHPNDKCYVCSNLATGSVFGQAVCAPCKKFVWRHRFSNINALRCEVGFGPQRNNCDLTRKRSCTKCRLRRSIDGNKKLRQFLDKNAMQEALLKQQQLLQQENAANNGSLDGSSCQIIQDEHVQAMDKLRGFLATKKSSNSPPLNVTSDDDERMSSSSSSSGSLKPQNLTVTATTIQPPQLNHSPLSPFVAPSTSSPSLPQNAELMSRLAAVKNHHHEEATDDSRNAIIYNYLMWAINYIAPTYSDFTAKFVELFRNCLPTDRFQLALLAAKQSGAELGGFGDALLAVMTLGDSQQCQNDANNYNNRKTLQLPDVLFAFNLYFSMAASTTTTPADGMARASQISTVLEAIRTNPCFAQLSAIPMQIVIASPSPSSSSTSTSSYSSASSITSTPSPLPSTATAFRPPLNHTVNLMEQLGVLLMR